MKKKNIIWLLAIAGNILVITLVIVLSYVYIPGWKDQGGGLLILVSEAAVGVLGLEAVVFGLVKAVQKFTKTPAEKHAPPPPTEIRNIEAKQYFEGGVHQHIYPEPKPASQSASSLPPSTAARFIDRGSIMDELRQALARRETSAIVGVGGMGGVGKSELALHLAQELDRQNPGSIVWVYVGDRPLETVQAELGRALGVVFPPTCDAEGRYAMLCSALSASTWTLVLDDVRPAFLPSLHLCLPPPPSAALITSRQHELPGLPPGALRDLDVMTESQALEMLGSIAGLERVLQQEPNAAMELVRACGCHPLALDLAARRLLKALPTLPEPKLASFVGDLTDRMAQLKVGGGNDKQQSLQANFDLSYDDLESEQMRRFFRRLAVFAPSGFCLSAAAAVCEVEEDEARTAVDQLQDASLLMPAGVERWKLHDLVGEYATGKLSTDMEEMRNSAQHLSGWLVKLFRDHYADDPVKAPNVSWELDNLRQAVRFAGQERDGERLARLATAARNWLITTFNIYAECARWLEEALELGIADQRLRAWALEGLGYMKGFHGEHDAALKRYLEALELARIVGDRMTEANALHRIGEVQRFRSEYDAAMENLSQAHDIFRAIGGRLGEANTLRLMGGIHQNRYELDAAMEVYRQVQDLDEASGNRLGQANTWMSIGDVFQMQGLSETALESYQKGLELFRMLGSFQGEAIILRSIGDVQEYRGELDDALESYTQALELFTRAGSPQGEAAAYASQGQIYLAKGDQARADELLKKALDLFRSMGERYSIAVFIGSYGWVLYRAGQKVRAHPYLLEAARLFEELGLTAEAERHRRAAQEV